MRDFLILLHLSPGVFCFGCIGRRKEEPELAELRIVREHYNGHIAERASCSSQRAILIICCLRLLGAPSPQATILSSCFWREPSRGVEWWTMVHVWMSW